MIHRAAVGSFSLAKRGKPFSSAALRKRPLCRFSGLDQINLDPEFSAGCAKVLIDALAYQ